jgi:DNA-binding MarR family transcriptional regulator
VKPQRQGGFLISKIHRTAGRVFAKMLRERQVEVNPAQGRILFVLWQEGPMTIHELAKRVSLGKSTLTSALDRLEAQGQVVRVRSREDRRAIVIELTEENRALHKTYEDVSREMSRIFYAGFTNEEITRLEEGLERVLQNVVRSESEGKTLGRE